MCLALSSFHLTTLSRKLYEAFASNDPERSGYISRKQWVKSMAKVLKLPLLWGKIYPYLVVPSPDGRVQYIDFLDRFKIDVGEYELLSFPFSLYSEF